jgi:hypothetical protein
MHKGSILGTSSQTGVEEVYKYWADLADVIIWVKFCVW